VRLSASLGRTVSAAAVLTALNDELPRPTCLYPAWRSGRLLHPRGHAPKTGVCTATWITAVKTAVAGAVIISPQRSMSKTFSALLTKTFSGSSLLRWRLEV
jgi:hypothetical protein